MRGLEGKEWSGEEGPGGSWEIESCGGEGEEKEDNRVSPATSGQGVRRRGCPIGGDSRIPDHRIQMQGDRY